MVQSSCVILLLTICGLARNVKTGVLSSKDQHKYKARTVGFSSKTLEDPNGNNNPRRPLYKYVDIVEIPTDEMNTMPAESSQIWGGTNVINDMDNLTSIVNDANWPQPIAVNGPNSNLNTGGLLNTLNSITNNKWLPEKKSSYTKDFGSFIGRFRPRAHGITGNVYAVDDQNLFIRNFWYDGTGPDAYFWVGNTRIPTPKGWVVPYPPVDLYSDLPKSDSMNMEVASLKKMKNNDVLLTLPGTLKVRDIGWLSVWCKRFTVNYGEVYIPSDLEIPEKVTLSTLSDGSSGKLNSGPITILDSSSFYIRNLQLFSGRYSQEDNPNPGYHFWVGNSTNMQPNRDGFLVPNEKARIDDLTSYTSNDIIITLPKGLTMFDINYLSIYNDKTEDNLGHIQFDIRSNKIPPALGQTKKPGWWFDVPTTSPPAILTPSSRGSSRNDKKPDFVPFNHTLKLPNCRELLGRKVRLLWTKDDTEVYFRIQVHMEISQFAAVGIASEGSPMIDADFVRIFYNKTSNQFDTEDAFLSKELNCDFVTGGLCADSKHDMKDHVTFMGSHKNVGLTIIDFKRSIMPHDSADAPIPMEGPCQVIVAIGRIRSLTEGYSVNTPLTLETENTTIDFSSTNNFCPDANSNNVMDGETEKEEGWARNYVKDKNLLIAQLGPTGGKKGYGTITGEPPSEKSVCWWINNKLMPELYVYRGQNYAFRVQGGDGLQHIATHNPLYITDHRDGGYGLKTDYEKERETIYAGVYDGQAVGVGTICEFVSKEGADKADQSSTFQEYSGTLQLACEKGRQFYGWVNWTVAANTPDLLYYQSYKEYGMGWKIHVLDEGEEPSCVPDKHCQNHAFMAFFLTICLHAYFIS